MDSLAVTILVCTTYNYILVMVKETFYLCYDIFYDNYIYLMKQYRNTEIVYWLKYTKHERYV